MSRSRQTDINQEMTHYMLWDAGLNNVLTDKQTEAVCDAVGTYLAAAQRAGYIKAVLPHKGK